MAQASLRRRRRGRVSMMDFVCPTAQENSRMAGLIGCPYEFWLYGWTYGQTDGRTFGSTDVWICGRAEAPCLGVDVLLLELETDPVLDLPLNSPRDPAPLMCYIQATLSISHTYPTAYIIKL